MSGPRTLGVLLDGFIHTTGMMDFIVGFVDGLVRVAGERKVVLILRSEGDRWKAWPQKFRDIGMPKLPMFVIPRSDQALSGLCRKQAIDVVGPLSNPPGAQVDIPWFGYMFDFQHRYFPKLFTEEERRVRDAVFGTLLHGADVVVVNSRAVKRDAAKFFPDAKAAVHALPFSAAPKAEWLALDPAGAQRQYGTGPDYFLVSNQFWLHKRHEIAIAAFARLAGEHPTYRLVLTGSTEDWRAPNRLADITALTARLGVADRVDILGLIPKTDQIALMRGARAVIQPTAFEGGPGGGSAFDAIALGVPAIVSDIPVNREIEQHVFAYFPLDDIRALHDRMARAIAETAPRTSADTLLAEGAERRQRYGQTIWGAADEAFRVIRARAGAVPSDAR